MFWNFLRLNLAALLLGALLVWSSCAPLGVPPHAEGPIVRVLLSYVRHAATFELASPASAGVDGHRFRVRLAPGLYRVVVERGLAETPFTSGGANGLAALLPLHGPVESTTRWPAGDIAIRLEDGRGQTVVRAQRELLVVASRVKLSEPEDTFPGELVFVVDGRQIAVVNRLPLESYLKGVVPAEMWGSAPEEALKAQAVVARSTAWVLLKRRRAGSPYDFCSSEQCQVYRGVSVWSRATSRAVRQTWGEVLSLRGKVCEAPYSAVCGGHTEDASLVWSGEQQPYLRGVLDASLVARLDLTDEGTLRRWLSAKPRVFCSPDLSDDPSARQYFRWRVRVSEKEIRQRIRTETGVDVGRPLEIRVVRRGVSGRALSVLVFGPLGRVKIKGELRVRRLLSRKALPSSCFLVTRKGSGFEFTGAGFGHGVGLCQAGAVGMAGAGRSYRDILEHYYPGTGVARKY